MSCNKKNSIITNFKRILVIGDLHADYDTTVDLFKYFKIIDVNKKWTAKDTFIVQLGDQIDGKGRGHEDAEGEHEVLEFLDELNEQAKIYGGAVYSLIGNHEVMNVMGNFNYASEADINKDGGILERKKKFTPGGSLAKRMACSRNAIIKIDDIIFVHGGISLQLQEFINSNENIEFINTTMRDFFLNNIDENNPYVKKFFLDSNSLLWDRTMGKDNYNCGNLSYLKCGHIVVGHTPQDSINSKCSNKIWRTDIGLSKAMGKNNYQILEITKDNSGNNKFNILR